MENEEQKETSSSHDAAEGTHTDHTHHEKSGAEAKNTKFKWSVLLVGLLGALVVLFLIFYGTVMAQVKKLSQESWVLKSAAFFQMPAVKAEGDTLLYTDYINDVSSLKKLSSNPTLGFNGASDQEISDLVVANFLNTIQVKAIAKKLNVEVTAEEMAAKKNDLFTQYGGEEEVKKTILDNYGWDLDTFGKKVLEPAALAAEAREAFSNNPLPEADAFKREEVNVSHVLIKVEDMTDKKNKAAKLKVAQGLLARLQKGEEFAKIASEFSEDPGSKEKGGNLGWIPRGVTVDSFEKVAFTLEQGKLSEIVQSDFGFHIIKVIEKGMRADYDAFMDSELKKLKPTFYIPIHNPLDTLNAAPAPAVAPEEVPPTSTAPAPTN